MQNLTATPSATNITFSWDAPDDSDVVPVSYAVGVVGFGTFNIEMETFTEMNFIPDTVYVFSITPMNSFGQGQTTNITVSTTREPNID